MPRDRKPFARVPLLIGLAAALLAAAQAKAQAPLQGTASPQDFVQQAVATALDFTQGDIGTLNDARAEFTPEAWSAFVRGLQGWLDDNGAPKFGSHFTPSAPPTRVGDANGIVAWVIPGTLKQTQNTSSTTFRVKVDVRIIEAPMKIEHLEVTTCGGASRVASCN